MNENTKTVWGGANDDFIILENGKGKPDEEYVRVSVRLKTGKSHEDLSRVAQAMHSAMESMHDAL